MDLETKVNSLSPANTVAELKEMLSGNGVHVSISWGGKRLVSIDGYKRSMDISALARKFLAVPALQRGNRPGLQERLDCDDLWGRVEQLYADSNAELDKTWIYKYLVLILELRFTYGVCSRDPKTLFDGWDDSDTRLILRLFEPEEYARLWPNRASSGIVSVGDPYSKEGQCSTWSIASLEQIESAIGTN